jgi:DNA-directed RNA polymerase subunit N
MSRFPIRCFTCGKVIGDKEEKFNKMVEEKIEMKTILDDLKLTRFCCRRMFLGYQNLEDKINMFSKDNNKHNNY